MIAPILPETVIPAHHKVTRLVEVSLVITARKEASNIPEMIARVDAKATRLNLHHETLIPDDGSTDATCAKASATEECGRMLRPSRNFGNEQAIIAGLGRPSGAAVVILCSTWITLQTLLFGLDVLGQSKLVVAACLIGGMQLISTRVRGESLSQVFGAMKGRPGFINAEETASEALAQS
jgi:hypothetical protein